ncbi:small multidrug resistance pump [Stackebrandtia endophytica]|uniref:Small multidrug resistance pump n=1 Tax=Stackebrandtia endophytica TaxID=1496996 RepID=A0A543AQ37_9ACTN|nr:multidrug efflux SMR transporter [Stackebrandtia endophytica]TQL74669.1 small multidrug resistance pump [Stackebrandtia endophytica]
MAYLFLSLAITSEVIGTSLLKSTEGFTKLWPTAASLGAYAVAFYLLARTVEKLEVGMVYALWSGVGTVIIVIIGMLFLNEPVTAVKVLGIGLVVGGAVILNLGGTH